MRQKLLALAVPSLLLAAASPSFAATIVQTISGLSQGLGDFTPFDINALPFNLATGTLDDVTVEIIGSYTPETANDLGPFPPTTTLTTRLFVVATRGGPTTNIDPIGTQVDIPVTVASPSAAGIATGAATTVDQTVDFSDLSAFEAGVPGQQLLVEYGFRTNNTLSGVGGDSDLTSFSGHAILTYDYQASAQSFAQVPEPASFSISGAAFAGMAFLRRRKSALRSS